MAITADSQCCCDHCIRTFYSCFLTVKDILRLPAFSRVPIALIQDWQLPRRCGWSSHSFVFSLVLNTPPWKHQHHRSGLHQSRASSESLGVSLLQYFSMPPLAPVGKDPTSPGTSPQGRRGLGCAVYETRLSQPKLIECCPKRHGQPTDLTGTH